MKKTLLAAALLAGFAGAASAQSSVTLYGIIDIGLQYQSISVDSTATTPEISSSRFGMTNGTQSGSRWGLSGTEDLGNGLRAVFVLENGFDSADGSSKSSTSIFNRQSTLGLASNQWGQVDFGRQTNMASKYFAAVDPFGLGFTQANGGAAFTSANTVRYSNMVMYQTPSISGFNAGLGYSFDTGTTNVYQAPGNQTSGDNTDYPSMNNPRAVTLGLNYSNGPLYLMASYDQVWAPNNLKGGSSEAKPKTWILGGTYDFKVVKLALAYGQQRGGSFFPQSIFGTNSGYIDVNGIKTDYSGAGNAPSGVIFNQDSGFNSYLVGLSAPIGGAHKVFGSWQMAQPNSSQRDLYTAATGNEGKNMNIYSLGYTYDFSKRTNLYAYVSYMSNWAFVDSAKSTVVGTGIRHRF